LKILHISSSNIYGGSTKAAINLHKSLLKENVQSFFLSQDNVLNIHNSLSKQSSFTNILNIIKNGIARKICKTYKSKKKETLSISIFNTNILNRINNSDCDLVNLHWICNEFISIHQIKKINKPIVWSLYDMWAFSGAEHYSDSNRYIEGYLKNNRNKDEKGFDINKWVWMRKLKNFNFQFPLVAPSEWLKDCAKKSFIFKDFKIHKIGHAIDVNKWGIIDKDYSKDLFEVDKKKKLIIFFSSGSTQNHRKGLDYLFEIIKNLKIEDKIYELIIVGQEKKYNFLDKKNVRYIDFLKDDMSRKILYNAADLILAPSRTEAFGLVVAEAAACGTPSVGFENTGVSEIILQKKTGYLAKEDNVIDFAKGIEWFFEDYKRFSSLGIKAQEHVLDNFSDNIIAKQYISIYKEILNIQ
jgi:glycosyltransferase involved in cell wall biosynthesis